MALSFNGSSDFASVAVDLSGASLLSVSFWLWWTAFANDDKLALEYTPGVTASGLTINPDASSSKFNVDMNFNSGGGGEKFWADDATRPSAAAWHHYVVIFNRSTPVNAMYLDGASASLTANVHNAGAYGNFSNSTLYVMSRAGTSLFGAGRMCELVLWAGVTITAAQAAQLNAGQEPTVVQASPTLATIRRGHSDVAGELTDWSGNSHNLSVTGTAFVADPPALVGPTPVDAGVKPDLIYLRKNV